VRNILYIIQSVPKLCSECWHLRLLLRICINESKITLRNDLNEPAGMIRYFMEIIDAEFDNLRLLGTTYSFISDASNT
jgi:hypothetical protein